jgi:hypothetical protein
MFRCRVGIPPTPKRPTGQENQMIQIKTTAMELTGDDGACRVERHGNELKIAVDHEGRTEYTATLFPSSTVAEWACVAGAAANWIVCGREPTRSEVNAILRAMETVYGIK